MVQNRNWIHKLMNILFAHFSFAVLLCCENFWQKSTKQQKRLQTDISGCSQISNPLSWRDRNFGGNKAQYNHIKQSIDGLNNLGINISMWRNFYRDESQK